MRRRLIAGALVAAVFTLGASLAVAVGVLSDTASGPAMMRGDGAGRGMMGGDGAGRGMMGGGDQGPGGSMMGGSMMGGAMMGGSMMGGSMMGGSMMGGSMMGGGSGMGMQWLAGDGVAVSSIPAARSRAATAATPAGLSPGEVMWFENGFYVELKDTAGKPATEVIVDPRNGAVSTEPGPAMMWNTRFGMHGNNGGNNNGGNAAAPYVDAAKARAVTASWLATNQKDATIASIDAYPGYYTVDLARDGKVSGMLSVSSATGAVWYHTWHGAFIAMQD